MMRQDAYRLATMMDVVNPDAVTKSDILACLLLEGLHRERAYLWHSSRAHRCPANSRRLKQLDRFLARIAEVFGLSEPDHITWHPGSVAEMARDDFSLDFDPRLKVLEDIVDTYKKLLKEEQL